jgi:hypothetical protein
VDFADLKPLAEPPTRPVPVRRNGCSSTLACIFYTVPVSGFRGRGLRSPLCHHCPIVPNENSVRPASDAIPQGEAKSVSRSRPRLSLANEDSPMHARAREHSPDTDFKPPREAVHSLVDSGLSCSPSVRNGDATHRRAVPPRRTPFPAAESLVCSNTTSARPPECTDEYFDQTGCRICALPYIEEPPLISAPDHFFTFS